MALTLGSTAATAGVDFSTTVSGFDKPQRQIVNSSDGRYRLTPVDATTMQLSAKGEDLRGGTIDRVTIEQADGLTSSGRTRETFEISVAPAAAIARPSLTVVEPPFGATAGATVNGSNLPAGTVYDIRDARSQRRVDVSRLGLTFNSTTGAVTGTLQPDTGYEGLTIVALKDGREVARTGAFALYNPPVYVPPASSGGGGTPTPTPAPVLRVLAEGDSITDDSQAPTKYPNIWAAAHPAVPFLNLAVGGGDIDEAGGNPNNCVARKSQVDTFGPSILTLLIGANGLGTDAQAYLNRILAYTDSVKATNPGCKIIVGTILPRAAGGQSSAASGWAAKRAAFNTLLRQQVGTKITDIFDFDTSLMGVDGVESNLTYFETDQLHPKQAGQDELAKVSTPVINWQAGFANEPRDFAFAPVLNATLDTDYDSAAYTVAGFYTGESRPYQVQTGKMVSKNGGAWVLNGSGTVVNGDTLRVRNRSSTSNSAQTDVTLTIGTTTATYTVTTASAVQRDWVPTDLGSKLKLWLRPEGIAGANASEMATWPDSSGNSITVTGIGGVKPTVAAAAVNGLKAAKFLVAYNQAGFSLPAGYLTGRTSGAAFFVAKLDEYPSTAGAFAPFARNFGTDNTGEYYPFTNRNVYSSYGSTTRQQTPEPAVSLANWRVASFHAATNDWRYYVDGTSVYGTSSNTFANGTSPGIAGGGPDSGNTNGLLAEWIDCTSALTTTERQLVEGYLAWKFALQANLPSGHPYKSAKPTI